MLTGSHRMVITAPCSRVAAVAASPVSASWIARCGCSASGAVCRIGTGRAAARPDARGDFARSGFTSGRVDRLPPKRCEVMMQSNRELRRNRAVGCSLVSIALVPAACGIDAPIPLLG